MGWLREEARHLSGELLNNDKLSVAKLISSVTSIPDNIQLNMTYTDPVTGKNTTCWDHCPLSTDSKVGGQDFVFTAGARNMTGLQMQLKTWIGAGAGLSSVELLSPGKLFHLECWGPELIFQVPSLLHLLMVIPVFVQARVHLQYRLQETGHKAQYIPLSQLRRPTTLKPKSLAHPLITLPSHFTHKSPRQDITKSTYPSPLVLKLKIAVVGQQSI